MFKLSCGQVVHELSGHTLHVCVYCVYDTRTCYIVNMIHVSVCCAYYTKQDKLVEFISTDEGLFSRSMLITKHKSHLSNPKFNFGIIKIITKACPVCFSAKFNKKNTYICTISISDLSTQPRGQRCV